MLKEDTTMTTTLASMTVSLMTEAISQCDSIVAGCWPLSLLNEPHRQMSVPEKKSQNRVLLIEFALRNFTL